MPETDPGRKKRVIGTAVCIAGTVCMILWGLLSVLLPSASEQISESSVITVNGNGIVLILCLAAIAGGAVMLLSNRDR